MPATYMVPNDVQAQLGARIDSIGLRLGRAPLADLEDDIAIIRRIARDHRIGPALSVVHAIEAALARGERGPLVQGWLGVLRDAIGCERRDGETAQLFAAACAVRLAH